jgi:hypothetical protein
MLPRTQHPAPHVILIGSFFGRKPRGLRVKVRVRVRVRVGFLHYVVFIRSFDLFSELKLTALSKCSNRIDGSNECEESYVSGG